MMVIKCFIWGFVFVFISVGRLRFVGIDIRSSGVDGFRRRIIGVRS